MANFYSQMMCRLLFNTSSRKNKNITRFVVRKFLDVYNAAHVVLYPTIPVLTCFRCKICASVFQQAPCVSKVCHKLLIMKNAFF